MQYMMYIKRVSFPQRVQPCSAHTSQVMRRFTDSQRAYATKKQCGLRSGTPYRKERQLRCLLAPSCLQKLVVRSRPGLSLTNRLESERRGRNECRISNPQLGAKWGPSTIPATYSMRAPKCGSKSEVLCNKLWSQHSFSHWGHYASGGAENRDERYIPLPKNAASYKTISIPSVYDVVISKFFPAHLKSYLWNLMRPRWTQISVRKSDFHEVMVRTFKKTKTKQTVKLGSLDIHLFPLLQDTLALTFAETNKKAEKKLPVESPAICEDSQKVSITLDRDVWDDGQFQMYGQRIMNRSVFLTDPQNKIHAQQNLAENTILNKLCLRRVRFRVEHTGIAQALDFARVIDPSLPDCAFLLRRIFHLRPRRMSLLNGEVYPLGILFPEPHRIEGDIAKEIEATTSVPGEKFLGEELGRGHLGDRSLKGQYDLEDTETSTSGGGSDSKKTISIETELPELMEALPDQFKAYAHSIPETLDGVYKTHMDSMKPPENRPILVNGELFFRQLLCDLLRPLYVGGLHSGNGVGNLKRNRESTLSPPAYPPPTQEAVRIVPLPSKEKIPTIYEELDEWDGLQGYGESIKTSPSYVITEHEYSALPQAPKENKTHRKTYSLRDVFLKGRILIHSLYSSLTRIEPAGEQPTHFRFTRHISLGREKGNGLKPSVGDLLEGSDLLEKQLLKLRKVPKFWRKLSFSPDFYGILPHTTFFFDVEFQLKSVERFVRMRKLYLLERLEKEEKNPLSESSLLDHVIAAVSQRFDESFDQSEAIQHFTDRQIAAVIISDFLAAIRLITSTLCFSFANLSSQSMDKIRQLKGEEKQNTIKAVILETFRLYPFLPLLNYSLGNDAEVGSHRLRKDALVGLHTYSHVRLLPDGTEYPPEHFAYRRWFHLDKVDSTTAAIISATDAILLPPSVLFKISQKVFAWSLDRITEKKHDSPADCKRLVTEFGYPRPSLKLALK